MDIKMSISPIIEMMQQQDDEDEEYERRNTVTLMDSRCRNFIWSVGKIYYGLEDGVMGSACILFERHISKKLNALSLLKCFSIERLKAKNELALRIPLLASTCISLATKMQSSYSPLTPTVIKEGLTKMKVCATFQEILNAEMEVRLSIDFHVPLYTNADKAMTMAKEVGMSGLMLEGVVIVTESAECLRLEVQNEILYPAYVNRYDRTIRLQDIGNIRHMHLVAGAVLATCSWLRYQGSDPAPRLAYLCRCEDGYIKCIGDVIYKCLLQICKPFSSKPVARKRRTLRSVLSDFVNGSSGNMSMAKCHTFMR